MTKWSNFINALGTAGPATLQGIYNLGFALRSEIPALFNKYVRVDASQSFSSPERLQGRDNLGLGTISTQAANNVNISGGTVTGITDLAVADGGTGASTAPAARTNLGLGNVDNTSDANKPISTAVASALADRYTKTEVPPALGPIVAALTAKPSAVDADILLLADSAATNASKAFTLGNLLTWFRGKILGTVSQSSGVPTGAIIERGSNANGEYVKFADGTQICTISNLAFPTGVTTGVGSVFQGPAVTWTFPSAFVSSPMVSARDSSTTNIWATAGGSGLTSCLINLWSPTSSAGARTVVAQATGRWF